MRRWVISLIIFLALLMPGNPSAVEARSGSNALAPLNASSEPYLLNMPQTSLLATADSSVCYGLDIIFLIDQSSSMSGRAGLEGNDPRGDRAVGAQHALDWLSSNRLSFCNQTVHRIAMISFASEARLDLPFTDIAPTTQADWDQIGPAIEAKIKAYDMGKADISLGNTDHLKAFELAKKTFNALPVNPNELRKRAIILVTDGQACVTSVGCSLNPNDPINSNYLKGLEDYINSNFGFSDALKKQDAAWRQAVAQYGNQPVPQAVREQVLHDNAVSIEDLQKSTYIYMLTLNKQTGYLAVVATVFNRITSNHDGRKEELKSEAIAMQINQIMSEIAGVSQGRLGCGYLEVDPYMSGMIMDVFKLADGLEVNISLEPIPGEQHPGKNLLHGQGDTEFFGVKEYSEHGRVEHYRFVAPHAGAWKIDASGGCDSIEVTYQKFNPVIAQVEPTGNVPVYPIEGASSDPLHPQQFAYQIKDDASDTPLNDNPEFKLVMKSIITQPDGSQVHMDMQFASNGTWQASPIPVNQLGDYKIDIVATAPCAIAPDRTSPRTDCPGGMFEVLRATNGKYTTGNVKEFSVKLLKPQPGVNIPLHLPFIGGGLAIRPVQVVLQVQDENGAPAPYATYILGDPSDALPTVLEADGKRELIKLVADPNDASKLTGTTLLPVFDGQNSLKVDLNPTGYDHSLYVGRGLPASVTFPRDDPFWSDPKFWEAVKWFLIAVALGLLGVLIYLRTNPVKGSLQFSNVTGTHRVSLYTGWRFSSVTPNAAVRKATGLRRVVAHKLKMGGGNARVSANIVNNKGSNIIELTSEGSGNTFDAWQVSYTGGGVDKRSGRPGNPSRPHSNPPSRPQAGNKKKSMFGR